MLFAHNFAAPSPIAGHPYAIFAAPRTTFFDVKTKTYAFFLKKINGKPEVLPSSSPFCYYFVFNTHTISAVLTDDRRQKPNSSFFVGFPCLSR